MTDDILPSPCPHCGGPALVQYLRKGWRVACFDLETRNSCQHVGKSSWKRGEAIGFWNEADDNAPAPASLEAPKEPAEQQDQEQEVDLTESLFA